LKYLQLQMENKILSIDFHSEMGRLYTIANTKQGKNYVRN
jgi:hypothetical protein